MQIVTRRFSQIMRMSFSSQPQNPLTPAVQTFRKLYASRWLEYDESHQKSSNTHKSKAEYYIHQVPVIEVEQDIVRCMGGTMLNAGHPQVYIQLNTRTPGQIQVCKYCGLRFKRKDDHHHHEHHHNHDHH